MNAQKKEIHWLNFEQLEDALQSKPKKVFISFYADWCVYCKKMDKVAFKNSEVIAILNSNYYAVKMDAEYKGSIFFGGKEYVNQEFGKSRKPTHQIPLLLAQRKNKPFSLPVNLILDKNFKIEKRFFEYLSPKKMISILK
ncbi:thioredoxin family protein [Polaribacter sp.]|uniref:thioredoxin family protein n=1 Tax=Polaribacter sp. TaxID=1920175 RepID=UPI003F6D6834